MYPDKTIEKDLELALFCFHARWSQAVETIAMTVQAIIALALFLIYFVSFIILISFLPMRVTLSLAMTLLIVLAVIFVVGTTKLIKKVTIIKQRNSLEEWTHEVAQLPPGGPERRLLLKLLRTSEAGPEADFTEASEELSKCESLRNLAVVRALLRQSM